MRTLNNPVGCGKPTGDDDWTPARGLARGAARGVLAALALIVGLAPVVMLLPYLFLLLLTRAAMTFAVAWLLLRVVCGAAGMVARPCAAIALALAALVMLSHHLIFALYGVPALAGMIDSWWLFPVQLVESVLAEQGGWVRGWGWFHPYVLLAVNAFPVLVMAGVYTFYGRE